MSNDTTVIVQKASTAASYIVSTGLVVDWFTDVLKFLTEFAPGFGVLLGVVTLLLNWKYQAAQLKEIKVQGQQNCINQNESGVGDALPDS